MPSLNIASADRGGRLVAFMDRIRNKRSRKTPEGF